MAKKYREIIKRTDLPYIRFHDLWHTHATLMIHQGVHPKVFSERVGHSIIGITIDTYILVFPNIQKEAAQQLEQLIK